MTEGTKSTRFLNSFLHEQVAFFLFLFLFPRDKQNKEAVLTNRVVQLCKMACANEIATNRTETE